MMRALIIVMMFFVVGALLIISNHNLAISSHENLASFGKIYLGWLGNIYSNFAKMSGDVIRLDWLPNKSQ